MVFNQIKGFFVNIGSYDLPDLSSWDKNFGFNAPDTIHPIYNYTLNDVKASFHKPYTIIRDDPVSQLNKNCLLLVESSGNENLALIEDIKSNQWTAYFKILSLVFENMTTFGTGADDPLSYVNRGDEYLATDILTKDIYQIGSFKYSLGKTVLGLVKRIQYFQFVVKIDDLLVPSLIYFDPDYLIQKATSGAFTVWEYEDDDEYITQDEMRDKIVEVIHAKTKTGKYKRVDEFKTRYRVTDHPPEKDDYFIEKQFFVFSNYSDTPKSLVTDQMKREEVKKYLRNKHPGTAGETWLILHYPDLFTQSTVEVYPLYENRLTENNLNLAVHGINGVELSKFLQIHNLQFDPRMQGGIAYEIIHVGSDSPITSNNPYIYNYPVIFVSDPTDLSVDRPVSDRFPTYAPIFRSDNIESEAQQFHLYLIYALNIATGINTLAEIQAITPYSTAYTEEPTQGIVAGKVSFIFKNVLWVVECRQEVA